MKNKIINIKENINKEENPLRLKSGCASGVPDFFDKIIKKQFANKESIREIHKTLLQYINSEKTVFIIRLYGSDSKKIYNNLRRGFLTIYPDGRRVVFCDNTFAMPFAALKCVGISYGIDELHSYMNETSTRFGFASTKEEQELAFYHWNKNKANINLNSYGWYLAHIVPVGKNYCGKTLRDYFDNPKRGEWNASKKLRSVTLNLNDKELAVLKAHFLRMVHPLNSFLVPKRSLLAYAGNNIGEETELINYVQDYIKNEFKEEYSELNQFIQSNEQHPVTSSIGEIIWNESESYIKKEKSKIKSKRTTKAKPQEINEVDIYDFDEGEYLENKLRAIGKSVFIKLYTIVKDNPMINIEEIYRDYPEYAKISIKAQKSRLSNTKSIIKQGLDEEALNNIIRSSRMSESDRQKAEELLQAL